MIRFRWYYDKEKEERWLNRMVGQGWAMKRFLLGFYCFESCRPGEYIYRKDLFTEGKGGMTRQEYIDLILETGAECVCSWGWYRIFRRKAELGDFELYTDNSSRLEQYQRFFRLFRNIGILELGCLAYELVLTAVSWRRQGIPDLMAFACGGIMLAVGIVIWKECFHIWQKMKKLRNEL